MLIILWEYMARPERLQEFETLYRPAGAWVELFKQSPGFVGTTLMRDAKDRHRYVIADRWKSEAAYETFKRDHDVEYEKLSRKGERLHRAEHLIGRFDLEE